MEKEILENHKKYLERISFYRSFGYDLEKERDFILDKSLPVSGKVLEIGTGKGHFALALAKKGLSFTTIDISEEEQNIAKLNARYFGLDKLISFKIEDAVSLSFPEQSFNVIFSINVFHHLEKPHLVLNEMTRLLKPAGKIVMSDFTEKGLEIINMCHNHEGRHHDHSKHDLDEAKRFFTDKGFSIKEFQSETQKIVIAEWQKTNK